MIKFASKSTRLRWIAFGSFIAICASLMFAACSAQENGGTSSGSGLPPGTGDVCAHPNPGCACDAVGATADCGRIEQTVGSLVMCAMGKTTCDGTKWGTCQGDTVVVRSNKFAGGAGLHVSALGSPGPCGAANVCDPYCNNVIDDPCGVDAAGLQNPDCGGFTVAPGGGNLCYCDEPSGGSAALYGNLPSPLKGNTGACIGGTTDKCQHDYGCSTSDGGPGTCSPYGVSGYNAACTTAPDFTVGMGCDNGTNFEIEVCNRGLVNAGNGNLRIAISGQGAGGPIASTCPFSGPAIPTGSSTDGYCTVNLTATPIGPGQCVTVDLATCTAAAGGPITLSSAMFFVANPSVAVLPTAVLPGYTPLPECDQCNNYSAKNAGLPGASACTNQICGTVCGGLEAGAGDGGDGGCHTYVTGTVYDPGANIPLPGISVYQPLVALTPFAPNVSCDTCSSVLPLPTDIASSTYSDINGAFALEVTATTGIPVVFQTGRWRRQITIGTDTPALVACGLNNITNPADCSYPGPNCKTRLPQVASEGDIPKMAIATGSAEPFECSIAKFMGGGAEMGAAGAGKRIELYVNNGTSTAGNVTVIAGSAASITATGGTQACTGWRSTVKGPGTDLTLAGLSNHCPSGRHVNSSNPVGGIQTISNLSGLVPADNGGTITLWGAGNAVNNGTFTLTYVNATTVTITNASGNSDPNNGQRAFHFAVDGPNGSLAAGFVGGTMALGGAGSGGNNGTYPIKTFISPTSVVITNGGGVSPDSKNGQSSLTWSAVAPGAVTITGLAGITAGMVGSTITLSNAATGANNGAFTIATATPPSSVTITNAGAVTDANNGSIAWSITTSSGSTSLPPVANLWPAINTYDQVILPCDGFSGTVSSMSTTARDDVYAFLKAGGKVFSNHYSDMVLVVPTTTGGGNAAAPFDTTSTFNSSIPGAGGSTYGRVAPTDGGVPAQQAFLTWLNNNGAYAGGGVRTPQPVITEALNPSATNSFEWIRASSNWGTVPLGDFNLIYSFDTDSTGPTPTLGPDGGAGSGCGRIISSSMHVDTTRKAGGNPFPTTECTLAAGLSPNEAAFEYLMFILSSCSIGGTPIANTSPPPPPPPPIVPSGVTFVRDFHAVCPGGTLPVWQLFNWQTSIPFGTSIDFTAQTAPDNGGVPGTYVPATPFSIGTASTTTSTWTTQFYPSPPIVTPSTGAACTVDEHLTGGNGCPGPGNLASQDWLRVTMTFNVSGALSPVLQQWEQLFDCMPLR